MEPKTSYQYTYFIYPFAIKEKNYASYIRYLMKKQSYQIKFFDSFANRGLYEYFVPTIRESILQDFSFQAENIINFTKQSFRRQVNRMLKQKCIMFEYMLENEIQGKIDEKDGIFFTISKIELICFQTGVCFLLIKTHLTDTNSFSDLLNFNYQFKKITLEKQSIKMQNNKFNNMNTISKLIEELTGQKLESKKIDRNETSFLVYTYACLESLYWNKDESFENIENEFIKLAEVKKSEANINVDYNKLSVLSNASYMKIRVSSKATTLICSAVDSYNYTKLPDIFENEYLYTYLIALHQKYYLKKLKKDFENGNSKEIMNKLITFAKEIWISEITEDDFGQKLYKRCREKFNLEELFYEVKCKCDLFYKKQNMEKNRIWNVILTIAVILSMGIGITSICVWKFFK